MKPCQLFFILLCAACMQKVQGQAPVISPKSGPIILHLDAAGNYTVQLNDVASITGNYNSVTLTPTNFSCADVGPQTIIINAANVTGNDPVSRLNYPYGVVVDAFGNLYVADSGNNQIKKITPAGVVSVFAGSGTIGAADGPGTDAAFARPWGLAIDVQNNIYVADAGNNKIRKITPAGMVNTIAGSGARGSKDGIGPGVAFNNPTGVALDAAGNIYVVDSDNNKIRKVTPDGSVSTFAGNGQFSSADGKGTDAGFYNPHGITIDPNGYLFITDGNNRIRKISPDADVITFAGYNSGNQDGTGMGASLYFPIGITIDALGNLYIAETGNNQIRMITPSGVVTTVAGNGSIGSVDDVGKNATFNAPIGIAIGPNGNLYVTDAPDNKIRKITPGYAVTTLTLSGTGGTIVQSASLPVNVTVLSEPVITSVYNNVTVTAYQDCTPVLPDYTTTATATDNCPDSPIIFTQSPAPGTPLDINTPMNVSFTATDASGATANVDFNVSVVTSNNSPVTFNNSNPVIFAGKSITLEPLVSADIITYSWSPAAGLSDPSAKNPLASPHITTTYKLIVTTSAGCTFSSDITVRVLQPIKIPNAFTPNGDEVNDFWNIGNLTDYPSCVVDIFTRRGQLVYHSIGYGKPWGGVYNGKPLPTGAYYYVIDLKEEGQKLSGEVTIIK